MIARWGTRTRLAIALSGAASSPAVAAEPAGGPAAPTKPASDSAPSPAVGAPSASSPAPRATAPADAGGADPSASPQAAPPPAEGGAAEAAPTADQTAEAPTAEDPTAEDPTAEDTTAPAKKASKVKLRATGHAKSFGLVTFPYESPLMPDAPQGQGVLDARLAVTLDVGRAFRLEVAHAITPRFGGSGAALALGNTGVGVVGNESVKLSWSAFGEDSFAVSGRTDRLMLRFKLPHVDVTLGRQPITFGTGLFFTPLDLINPFTPATIDTEVKPGVDAARVDVYAGVAGKVSAVFAYVGDPDTYDPDAPAATDGSLRALALAAHGQVTVGVTDIALMYGLIHADHVIGASLASGIGPVAVHADAALTVADRDSGDGVFFRSVLGASGMPGPTTTLSGELYVQTLGTTDPSQLLAQLSGERYRRGELWLGGVGYYGIAISQEFVPVLRGNLAVIGSLTEASLMLSPSIAWSIADNADLGVGGFVGIGARPDDEVGIIELLSTGGLRSEFGTYPGVVFTQVRAWF